ncbi:MAG: response regulator, partial [candidate division Zixibacteria bacterium]|nr:response regulator [candidate division Zixibacteria bacterium]
MTKALKSWLGKWSKEHQPQPELQQKLKVLALLDEITQNICQSLDFEFAFSQIAPKLKELIPFDYLFLFSRSSKQDVLGLENFFSESPKVTLEKGYQIKLMDGLLSGVLRDKKPHLEWDYKPTEERSDFDRLTARLKLRSLLLLPLVDSGPVQALLILGSQKDKSYTEKEREILEPIVHHLTMSRKIADLFKGLKLAYENLKNRPEENKQVDQFKIMKEVTSAVVHDFNNILATVLGRTQILQMKIEPLTLADKEKLQKSLKVIEKAVAEGGQLLSKLSRLYKPKSELRQLDLKEIIDDAVQITKSQWPDKVNGKQIEVETDKESNQINMIMGDGAELKVAFSDLILFTAQALPLNAKLTLWLGQDANQVRVNFRSSDKLDKLTLWQEKVPAELENCESLIQRQKGRISLEGKPEPGHLISLSFPAVPSTPAPDLPPPERVSATASPGSFQILLFEEQQSLGDILQEYLNFLGFRVRKFQNSKLALEVFNSDKFDLVFTDVGRAGMFGWNFIEQVKKVKPEVPVVIIAAKGISLNESELEKQGIFGVIY